MTQEHSLPAASKLPTGVKVHVPKLTKTGANPLQLSWLFFRLGHAPSLEACRKELEETLLFEERELAEG